MESLEHRVVEVASQGAKIIAFPTKSWRKAEALAPAPTAAAEADLGPMVDALLALLTTTQKQRNGARMQAKVLQSRLAQVLAERSRVIEVMQGWERHCMRLRAWTEATAAEAEAEKAELQRQLGIAQERNRVLVALMEEVLETTVITPSRRRRWRGAAAAAASPRR